MVNAADAEKLDAALEADLLDGGRLGKPRRYLLGNHDLPYMPRGAKAEYEHLANRAITNWTPLLSDTFAKGLFVDGYRTAKAADNATAWSYWQANGLDARQSIAHRGALEYGTSYTLILPGTVQQLRVPLMRPLSPLRSSAWYRDEDDEFPELAFLRKGTTADGTRLVEVYDTENRYTFAKPATATDNAPEQAAASKWILSGTESHGLGYAPFVRFRERLDGEAQGIIRPIITLQDRVNEIVFSTLIALQYASFRQRWATGLVIPRDENDKPIDSFNAAVNRLWVAEDHEVRFGDFAQTELSGHHAAYDLAVRTMAAIGQVSPNVLTGELVNVSAEALAQMQDTTQRKISEYETIFGESWESAFRLAAKAAGDATGAADLSSQVRWRDTEARSLAQTVDALGKIATMLSVPVEELWDKIPGITDQDVERWKAARQSDPLTGLVDELVRQGDSASATTSDGEDASAVKAKADALGALVRAGATFESAATKVGLAGIESSGAVPVSLRLPEVDAEELEQA